MHAVTHRAARGDLYLSSHGYLALVTCVLDSTCSGESTVAFKWFPVTVYACSLARSARTGMTVWWSREDVTDALERVEWVLLSSDRSDA